MPSCAKPGSSKGCPRSQKWASLPRCPLFANVGTYCIVYNFCNGGHLSKGGHKFKSMYFWETCGAHLSKMSSLFKVSNKRRDARQVPVDLRLLIRALQHPFVVWFSGLQLRVLCSTYALQGQHASPRVLTPSRFKWWHYSHFKVIDQRRDARRVPVDLWCLSSRDRAL